MQKALKNICTVFVGLAVLALIPSCRNLVFEDRTPCPAYVKLQAVPPVNPRTWENLDVSVWADGTLSRESMMNVYELNRGYYIPAEKNRFFEASLLGGWPDEWRSEGFLLIPEGNECPEGVGAYFGMEIGTDEIYYAPLELTYLYTNVVLCVTGASAGYGFQMTVDGDVDGFQYPGSGLHRGPFHAQSREIEYLRREVRIPRQVPFHEITRAEVAEEDSALDYLKADIYVENKTTGRYSHYVTIPLGEYIRSSGYDWSTAQLEEIAIDIQMFDESIMNMKVKIAGWEIIVAGDSGLTI